jgi:hypothetical protein
MLAKIVPTPKTFRTHFMVLTSFAMKISAILQLHLTFPTLSHFLLQHFHHATLTMQLVLIGVSFSLLLIPHPSRPAYRALRHHPVVVLLDVQIQRGRARVVSATPAPVYPLPFHNLWLFAFTFTLRIIDALPFIFRSLHHVLL